ncbi:MAG: alpha-mannosidase, partial [Oscillospiraceae bacterium]|nr:alpha-mannosidase [Oscillospiraceae bacterium]
MYNVQMDLISERIKLFEKAVVKQTVSIPQWTKQAFRYGEPIEYTPLGEPQPIRVGDTWRCGFTEMHAFESTVTIPPEMAGERVVLELSFGGEGLVFLDGKPASGVTYYETLIGGKLRHRERVDVSKSAVAGQTVAIRAEMYVNYKDFYKARPYHHYTDEDYVDYKFRFARLVSIDETSEQYLLDVQTVFEEIKYLLDPSPVVLDALNTMRMPGAMDHSLLLHARDDALVQHLTDALRGSLMLLPTYGTAEELRAAAKPARELLWREIGKIQTGKEGTVISSGFAHMDIVWLWQQKHTTRKIINTFCNTLALMERYPDYMFTFSQPYTYRQLEQFAPDVFEKVKEKIREGRIDPIGNLFIEMDANLASGESIVRQLLYGKSYYEEKFGRSSDVFFMPDSFGYPASLPQIMKRAGIRWFFTSKLSTNETWRFPYTYFRWQGIDGTQISSYLLRTPYNGKMTPERIEQTYRRMEDKSVSETAFLTYGFGDGGGGADWRMIESAERVAKLPGLPNVRHGTFSEFFREVFDNADHVPVWDDELYLDRHRATYTTNGKIKKQNRRAELLLRDLEIYSSMREAQFGVPYPKAELKELWLMILPLQFHDSLPGSSIPQVFRDADAVFERFFNKAETLLAEVLGDLANAAGAPNGETVFFSSLPFDMTRQIAATGFAPVCLPAFGAAWQKNNPADAVKATSNSLENKFFRLTVDESGLIASLYDKRLQKELFRKPGNELHIFDEITSVRLSAWDLYPETMKTCRVATNSATVTLAEQSDETAAIRVVRKFGSSTIDQLIRVYSDVDRVDIETHVDWHERMKLLKAAFYPAVHAREASYEIQFGALKRPTHRNTAYDALRFEACAHRWADLSQADCGVSVLNDCKYGYDVTDDTIRISLLRAPLEPDDGMDRGVHEFTYSIYPHKAGFELGGTAAAAMALNSPPRSAVVQNAAGTALRPFVTLRQPIADGVILDTVKKAENGDGYIFRFYEAVGSSGTVKAECCMPLASVTECDLMEENDATDTVCIDDNDFSFEFKP